MIRTAFSGETEALVTLGESTGIFGVGEADALLRATLDAFHAGELNADHQVWVWVDSADGVPNGWVYFAPRDGEAQAWELFWIGVGPSFHGQGIGSALLRFVEELIARSGGLVLYVETSSLPPLARARRLYERRGYTISGVTPNYYGEGDDMLTFVKALNVRVSR